MLESLFWLQVVLLLYVISATFLLPVTLAIMVSKRARSIWFSWIYVYLLGLIGHKLVADFRKRAFALLQERLERKNSTEKLEVLEVGAGDGLNLEFYPTNCNLTAVDMSQDFESYFWKRAKKYDHIFYKGYIIQDAGNMIDIPDNSMDVVVSTYFHCYLDNPNPVLKEVKRVLKPGGKYLFFEHVRYPSNEIMGNIVQKVMRPLNYLVSNGCILNRDIATIIRRSGFSDVFIENIRIDKFMVYLYRHQIIGVATKGYLYYCKGFC